MEIPRTIHRLWLGGDEPDWIKPFAETWRRPGWEVFTWDDHSVQDLFPLENQAVYDAAPVIAPDHVGQLRSDVLRYEILREFGGVWVDADFECLKPIDPLIEDLRAFAAWELYPVWVNNAFMGATPGHQFLDDLVSGLQESVEANMGHKPNVMSGPWYVTSTWRPDHVRDVEVLPEELFYPMRWDEVGEHEPGTFEPSLRWPEAYAVHWWNNKRVEKGIA